MKKLILVFCFSLFTFQYSFSQGVWTWMGGDTTANTTGLYGMQGTPSATNKPPGVYEPCEWTDLQGNFWLFGGVTLGSDVYGDLWKFDPLINEWTWMKGAGVVNDAGNYGTQGAPSISNRPPARGWGVATWTDLNGDLWMYGGAGHSLGNALIFSDLWKYNIASNTWTWMQGSSGNVVAPVYGIQGIPAPANSPGYRYECSATWVDSSGSLWMFGGVSYDFLNDLWKFNITSNEWTWMNGADSVGQAGVYGTLGIANPLNMPGGRMAYCTWKDFNGDFWLFGGACVYFNSFNDMWKYNPANNEWAWTSGSNQINNQGSYGAICASSVNFAPAGRFENRARWIDNCGKFWMYGGIYNASSPNQHTADVREYNDFWNFDPVTLQWTLAAGIIDSNRVPLYGAMGVPTSSSQPGARFGSVSWRTKDGTLYQFGGNAKLPNGQSEPHNDLWQYKPDLNCVGSVTSINLGNDTSYCRSFSRVLSSNYPNTQWSTGVTAPQITVTSPGKYWASVNSSCGVASDTINISVLSPPVSGILNSSRDSICAGTGVVSNLTDTGSGGQIQWQSSTDGINYSVIAGDTLNTYTTPRALAQTTFFQVVASNNCGSDTSNTVTVHILPAASVNFTYTINGSQVSFQPDSAMGGVVTYHWDFGDSQISSDTNPVHTFDSLKTYYVCLTVYNRSNCSFTNCQYVSLLSTGVKNISTPSSIRLYPNPANDELTIEVLNSEAPKQISITDGLGRTLIQLNTYKTQTQIDVHSLAAGIYFVKTKLSDGRVEVRKFVKE